MKLQLRNGPAGNIEIRADGDDSQRGIFEGYAVTWGYVDSYNTRFMRGCFSDSLTTRAESIKICDNHGAAVGVPLELREDDTGLFVRGQINIETEAGADLYRKMTPMAGSNRAVIDTLSFGFWTTPGGERKAADGVVEYTRVILKEISPVDFSASDRARISDVRSANFTETDLNYRGSDLIYALHETIWDIWYTSDMDSATRLATLDDAIQNFAGAYLEWAQSAMEAGVRHEPESELARWVLGQGGVDQVAQNTAFTRDDARVMLRGGLPDALDKIEAVPELAGDLRRRTVDRLCTYLRADVIRPAERQRLGALLSRNVESDNAPTESVALAGILQELKSIGEVK